MTTFGLDVVEECALERLLVRSRIREVACKDDDEEEKKKNACCEMMVTIDYVPGEMERKKVFLFADEGVGSVEG